MPRFPPRDNLLVNVALWFAENGIDDVGLMKVNIEGGEFEPLERMLDQDLLRRVQNLQIQFHNISFDATRLMERLTATHVPG